MTSIGLKSPIIGDSKYEFLSRRWLIAGGFISETNKDFNSDNKSNKPNDYNNKSPKDSQYGNQTRPTVPLDFKSFLNREHLLLHLHHNQAEFDSSDGKKILP